MTLVMIGGIVLLWHADGPGGEVSPATSAPAATTAKPSATSTAGGNASAVQDEADVRPEATRDGLPPTGDYRALAIAAAKGIYTWDSRSSSYSDVYAKVRSWWELLPDGSNPLSVLVREFEGTGVTAGTFTTLADQSARRNGTAESLRCDLELTKVQEYPAPWEGLHVCTVTVQVVDESSNGRSAYAAPVTVMVNCAPAPTAPSGRCAMVAFYATAEKIVY
ncbi:hypothetical protein [Pseudarthrobacter sulfonivorans]|uniref:hypothetical protein n=1 Tax=Pseudarthrobacter sulfonivorans TaxID=121292 RepID=UPI00277F81A5|nr:hypothetical protein [Pseudarthrobacter sulfonivorans]MDP9999059.1 hypothetical protein [Pseudarthrobacter sulfonivorans]